MLLDLHSRHLSLLTALGLSASLGAAAGCSGRTVAEDDAADDADTEADDDADTDTDTEPDTSEDEGTEPYACADPEPIVQTGTQEPSGFVRCADGFIHRAEAVPALDPAGEDACYSGQGDCATGADCTDKAHGRCIEEPFSGLCECSYGCETDADCDPGRICAPAGVAGRSTCIESFNCTTDSECGEGLCGLSEYEGCCGNSFTVSCAEPNAACHSDDDCPVDDSCELQCAAHGASPDGEWSCSSPGWCDCACGRPYFVEGEARVAKAERRRDWAGSIRAPRAPSAAAIREALAAHWTEVALFEHASVASFARFANQLLALGAPPRLIQDTLRAMADEVEHARSTFALASAYAGEPVGPGSLALAQPDSGELPAILDGLVVEACVGETLAALEARQAALEVEDAALAEVLGTIAEDEWRHAELGWRALGWLLERNPQLRGRALATFDGVLSGMGAGAVVDDGVLSLRETGVLSERARRELHRAAIAQVIRPCVDALRQADERSVVC